MGKRKKSMKDIFGCEYVDEDPLLQFLAYIMDNKNLTDHQKKAENNQID